MSFSTKKRLRYTGTEQKRIMDLHSNGKSYREIAKIMDMPFGSLYNILSRNRRLYRDNSRPSNNYITRAEAREDYNITDSQFDYVQSSHPLRVIKKGGKVFIDRTYFDLKDLK
jgi:hypothetical protein